MNDVIPNDVLGRLDDGAIIALVQDLVRIESINPPADYGQISPFIERWLSQLPGVEVRIVEPHPGKRNVVARLPGRGAGPGVLISNHMDVVPAGVASEWTRPPFAAEIADARMWGRGTTDMKGATAAQLHALKAVAEAGTQAGDVIVACTVDDETAGEWGMKYLAEHGFREIGWPMPAFHILGEPTSLEVVCAFKGRLWIDVKVRGRAAHGGNPERGVNAIDQMIRVASAFRPLMRTTHPLVGDDTFNLGVIEGGKQVNMVPEFCRARMDLRFGPAWNTEQLLAELAAVARRVSQESPTFTVETLDVFERREALEVAPEHPGVQRLVACAEPVIGRRPAFHGTLASGDLYHTARAGIPGVYWGPGNMALAHTTNEYIEIDEVLAAARVYARAMLAFTAEGLAA
jgi:succinyl-diaminopimelate desuccinylase